MIDNSSCNSFIHDGFIEADCIDVSLSTSQDTVEITFRAKEGIINFDFQISNFDNPYTTSAWGDFGIEI